MKRKQLLFSALLLVVGGVLGATVMVIGDFGRQPSEIWTAQQRLSTETGIVIPAGTELRLLSNSHGGAETLELFFQVEEKSRAAFDRQPDLRANLILPYLLRPDND